MKSILRGNEQWYEILIESPRDIDRRKNEVEGKERKRTGVYTEEGTGKKRKAN